MDPVDPSTISRLIMRNPCRDCRREYSGDRLSLLYCVDCWSVRARAHVDPQFCVVIQTVHIAEQPLISKFPLAPQVFTRRGQLQASRLSEITVQKKEHAVLSNNGLLD